MHPTFLYRIVSLNKKLTNYNSHDYIYVSSFVFLFFFLLFNPSNWGLLLLLCILVLVFYAKIHNFGICLLLVLVISNFLPVGKIFVFYLHSLPSNPYVRLAFPYGLTSSVILSFTELFSLAILFLLIKNIFNKTALVKKINIYDITLVLMVLWITFSNVFFSEIPILSLMKTKYLWEGLIAYLYIRLSGIDQKKFFNLFLSVIIVLVIFEGTLAFLQFIQSAPLGINIEPIHDYVPFGAAPDELSFIFRPTGTFFHANELGIFFATSFPILFAGVITKRYFHFVASLFYCLIGIALTLSRTGWLALYLSFMYFLYIAEKEYKQKILRIISPGKISILIAVLVLLFAYSMPRLISTTNSFQNSGGVGLRYNQILEIIKLLKKYSLSGVGTGMSVLAAIKNNKNGIFSLFPSEIHNYYLLLLTENGIPSLILFIIFLIGIFKRKSSKSAMLNVTRLASILAIIVSAFFQPSFNWIYFLIICSFKFDKITITPYDK